jgi:hypothetical protein
MNTYVLNRLVDDINFQTIAGHSSYRPNFVTAYEKYNENKYTKTYIFSCRN